MWSRVLFVGSLALSQRIPLSSLAAGLVPSSSSSTNANDPPTSSSRSKAVPLTLHFSSSESSCRDGEASDGASHGSCSSSSSAAQSSQGALLLSTSPVLSSFSFEKYHLLWSPHAWKKLLGTVIFMMIVPRLKVPSSMASMLQGVSFFTGGGSLYQNIVLPLAASSCCLLQLGLNLLSVGCAGWNSYLGPVRPYFLGILFMSNLRHRPPLSTLVWRSAVALLPEIVFVYNSWQRERTTLTTIETSNLQNMDQFVLEVDIPTMGCVACINAIDSRLRQVPGVLQVSSGLKPLGEKGGSAAVVVATDDTATMTNHIIEAVAEAGFDGAYLASMRPNNKN